MADKNKRNVGTKESPEYIKKLIVQEARKQGVDPALALAVAYHESGFNNIAVSPKNTNGSRDHGVFQLNDKYHHLKNVYDPQENIAYGIKHLKGLLAGTKGDVLKALSNYNAGAGATGEGRAKGNAYAQKVAKLIPTFGGKAIAQIDSSIPKSNAKIVQEGGKSKMVSNNIPTGAASPIDSSTYGIKYLDENGNVKVMPFNLALQGSQMPTETPADRLQNVNQQYIQSLQDPNIQQYMQYQPLYSAQDLATMSNAQNNALLQLQAMQQGGTMSMADRLNTLYNQQNDIIMSDPRLQDMGYYVDPNKADSSLMSNAGIALAGAIKGGTVDPNSIPSVTDRANARYMANLANQYGVPYEILIAAHKDRITSQLAANKDFATNLVSLQNEAAKGNIQAMQQLQALNKNITDLATEQVKQGGAFQKGISEKVIGGLSEGIPQAITQAGEDRRANQDAQIKLTIQQMVLNGQLTQQQGDLMFKYYDANLRSDTDKDVANIQKESSENVATINKEASKYSADKGLEGRKVTAGGNVAASRVLTTENPAEVEQILGRNFGMDVDYSNLYPQFYNQPTQQPVDTQVNAQPQMNTQRQVRPQTNIVNVPLSQSALFQRFMNQVERDE